MLLNLFKILILILSSLIITQFNGAYSQGNNCAAAESITIDGACDGPTTISQNNAAPTVACGAFTDEGWYTFTVTGGPINTTISAVSGDGNLAYVLYNVACASISSGATCVNANNTNGSAQTETSTASLVNGTYYIRIINIGTGGAGGNMSLTSLCVTSPPKVITASIFSTQSVCQNSVVTLTSSYTVNNGVPAVSYQWYSNTINSNSGGTAIGGATSSTYSPPTGTAGTFYYYCCIYTPGQNTSSNGPMSNVVTITVNATPTTSAAGSDQTTASCVTTAPLDGNSPVTGTGTWTCITNCGGVSITTPSSPFSGVTGLSAGVSTTFRWTIANGTCTSTDDVVITGGACGNNDLCTGGITATCNNSYSGTTAGMNTDAEDPACSAASAAGVWYVLAGTGGSVTASLCGSTYDTRLDVFSGTSCAAITTCIVGNDDFCGLQSQVTFATVIGTNYYILVNGYSTNTGTFTLNLSCCAGTVPNCATSPSPSNAAVGVSPCGTLSWTAATCNSPTSYDVYFGTSNPPSYVANVAGTTYSTPLTGSTTYYWEIRPRNASGPAASCSVWSFTTAAATNPQYNLVDDATSSAPYSCVTLTPDAGGQRGCAWDQNSTLGFASNFTYDWTINLGGNDGGADGMAFVIQNDPLGRCKCGTTGGSLGAGGITNSLIVELDTYINFEDRDDFNTSFIGCAGVEDPDHMDIWLNGTINPDLDGNCNATGAGERPTIPTAVRLQNPPGTNYNIENGLDHKLRISWNAGTSTLTAAVMNNATTITYATVSYTFNPMTVFGTNSPYFGFTGSTGGLSNLQTFCNPPALLPVEMSAFNMECETGAVRFNWETNSEHNNDYFQMEVSSDGVNYNSPIAIIDGAGNSTTTNYYSWEDENRNNEITYYRLSQFDFDGTQKILNTVASNCYDIKGINILAMTHTDGNLILNLENRLKDDYSIEIIDMTGKQVFQLNKKLDSGMNKILIDKSTISTGIYFVRVNNSIESVVKKVSLF